MTYLAAILLTLGYIGLPNLITKIIVLFLFSAFIIWMVFLSLAKLFKQHRMNRDFFLRMNFLRSLAVFMVLYNIYLTFLIYLSGLSAFQGVLPDIILNILAQLLLFIIVIIVFAIKYREFNGLIK